MKNAKKFYNKQFIKNEYQAYLNKNIKSAGIKK